MEENNVKKGIENVSIIAFVFSFVMPLVGLILSIIGLSKSKKSNSNNGLAIAGLIISIITLLLRVLLVGGIFFAFMFASDNKIFNKGIDKMCSKVEACVHTFGDYYNCSYKEGIVNYSVTCKEDQLPKDKSFKDMEDVPNYESKDLDEIKHLAEKYYLKMYDGVYEKSEISIIEGNKIEIRIYSGINDIVPSITITVDKDTLIGKDSQGYYVDLNEISNEKDVDF